MEIQFDDNIKRARFPLLTWLTSRQAFWVSVAVILACIFLSFATNSFATSNNLFNVTRNFTFVAIVALGMTIVIITGGIDLSVGSVLCLCSMILAVVMHAGYSIEVGIAAALGTALLIGAINGVLIAYLGIPPFVVTLGMLSIARSLAMVASNNTVVFQFGPDHDKLLFLGGGALLFGIANPVIYMLLLTLLTGFVLRFTRFGRYVFAIGGNEHAAIVTGVKPDVVVHLASLFLVNHRPEALEPLPQKPGRANAQELRRSSPGDSVLDDDVDLSSEELAAELGGEIVRGAAGADRG